MADSLVYNIGACVHVILRLTSYRTWVIAICWRSRTYFFEILTGILFTNVCKLPWIFWWSYNYYLIVFILNFYLMIKAKKARVTMLFLDVQVCSRFVVSVFDCRTQRRCMPHGFFTGDGGIQCPEITNVHAKPQCCT